MEGLISQAYHFNDFTLLSSALNNDCPYSLQSIEKVEKLNHVLRQKLLDLSEGLHLPWSAMLPLCISFPP